MACAIVTDCRALYDLILKENVQSTVDKRVAIETMVIRDLIGQLCAQLRWVSSERQLADGLTKIASRQQFSEALREGWMQLVHDETFTAAKKKTAKQREESRISTTSRVAMARMGRGDVYICTVKIFEYRYGTARFDTVHVAMNMLCTVAIYSH